MTKLPLTLARLLRTAFVCFGASVAAAIFSFCFELPVRYLRVPNTNAGIYGELIVGFILFWVGLGMALPFPDRPSNKAARFILVAIVSAIAAIAVMYIGLVGAWVLASHFPYLGRGLMGMHR
jgi:uncharacterized membrane protein